MKKHILFSFFILALTVMFSISVFAVSSQIDAESGDDIVNAIAKAEKGDTVTVNLAGDITLASRIAIEKAITVTVNFNGYQINYSGTTSSSYENAGFFVSNAGAVLNLNGSNPLNSVEGYSHYGESVKADMIGTSNLVTVVHGNLNIKDVYFFGSANAWVIHNPIVDNNDVTITIANSVLRVPENSARSAITLRGRNVSANLLIKRVIHVDSSVVYGGFNGENDGAGNFNATVGSSFTNVRFYDFHIYNDNWYNAQNSAIDPLLARSYSQAVLFENCVFQNYDGTIGDFSMVAHTGKNNVKLVNCTYGEVTGSLYSDKGGQSYIYVATKAPTCTESGLYTRYGSNLSTTANLVADALGHTLGKETMVYPNGYSSAGVGMAVCKRCSENVKTGAVYDALFVNLGYSAFEQGNSITLGTMINRETYEST